VARDDIYDALGCGTNGQHGLGARDNLRAPSVADNVGREARRGGLLGQVMLCTSCHIAKTDKNLCRDSILNYTG